MLLAVEGGGFFSSSASGYSKGLTLLLLGQRSDDKPMRVLPWNQYQLIDRESDSELQLASTKNRLSCGCTSFLCFGRASAGLDTPSHLKVGPAQQHDVSPGPLVSNKSKDSSTLRDNDYRGVTLKSSLKRPQNNKPAPVEAVNEHEAPGGKGSDAPAQTERRKVQWPDDCGSDLVKIREFEPREEMKTEASECVWWGMLATHLLSPSFRQFPSYWSSEADGSVDEFDNGNNRTCSCAVM